VTQALLERGWRVVGTSRTIRSSKDLTPSPDLVLVDGDVSKRETAIKVVEAALKHFGRIDLLVNNAGIFIPKAFTDYTASKALALEYAPNNIRFNTVSPGVVNTPMHAKGNHAELAKFHPLGRMGEVSDVVDAVLYLQNATFVTGENIRVDGGIHAGRSRCHHR